MYCRQLAEICVNCESLIETMLIAFSLHFKISKHSISPSNIIIVSQPRMPLRGVRTVYQLSQFASWDASWPKMDSTISPDRVANTERSVSLSYKIISPVVRNDQYGAIW